MKTITTTLLTLAVAGLSFAAQDTTAKPAVTPSTDKAPVAAKKVVAKKAVKPVAANAVAAKPAAATPAASAASSTPAVAGKTAVKKHKKVAKTTTPATPTAAPSK